MNCDTCNKLAVIHLTEIKDGVKSNKHLCQSCAEREAGLVGKHASIQELLIELVERQQGPASTE